MPHSFNKIWIHAIWSTKNRAPLISSNIEEKLYQFISIKLKDKGCPVRIVNGMPDHVHLLFLLNPQTSISEIIKQVKGSRAHIISIKTSGFQKNLLGRRDMLPFRFLNLLWRKSIVI
jgi:REP element-mobilizing transposase RayT